MDTTQLGSVASIAIDQAANEIFLADGYSNHRVIVLDAENLTYKRMWGAYGKQPTDMKMKNYEPEAPQFTNPVHCVKVANDGLVYVCDRTNRPRPGVPEERHLREAIRDPARDARHGLVLRSRLLARPQPDLSDHRGRRRQRGRHRAAQATARKSASSAITAEQAGQFHNIHQVVTDSKGNVYTGEVDTGMRIQKFAPNMPPAR